MKTDIKAYPNRRSPILVTGAHRSGTSWVGKMLAAGPGVAYISEPLNVLHRPGVMRVPTEHWYTYICRENEAYFLPALQETLCFRYHLWSEIRSLRSRKDLLRMGRDWSIFFTGRLRSHRPLIKDPFAVFSIPWFIQRLGCQVVVSVRHPAAFASSLKRLDWSFDFRDLLSQPFLMRDWLEPFRDEMEKMSDTPDDVIGQSSLLWRMIYQVVATCQESFPELQVVRHEDLSLDPQRGFQTLYTAAGLSFTPQARRAVLKSSSAENPAELSKKAVHAVRLDSRLNLRNWKKRLEPAEVGRIRETTRDVYARYYSESDWE